MDSVVGVAGALQLAAMPTSEVVCDDGAAVAAAGEPPARAGFADAAVPGLVGAMPAVPAGALVHATASSAEATIASNGRVIGSMVGLGIT